jgi:hypothetical protein
MMTGQAAGTAAAISVKNNITPCEIDVKELRNKLILDGMYI